MNGVHDMGGMDGMGPIDPRKDDPPFHAYWEARAFAHLLALGALGKWNNDAVRRCFESFAPSDYLRMRYFERWNAGLTKLLIETSVITTEEAASARADSSVAKSTPPLRASDVASMIAKGEPYMRRIASLPRFGVDDLVHSRNVHPTWHTRLPRYARGKNGRIERCHGGFVFPDSNSRFAGEQSQYLYSVGFDAHELWGERGAARTTIYLDIWEEHLEPR